MTEFIELDDNNLYLNGAIIDFLDGTFALERTPLIINGTELDQYHTVKQFDRLDLIAYTYYKDSTLDASKYWWVLADANNIENPLDISDLAGEEILIPDLNRIKIDL